MTMPAVAPVAALDVVGAGTRMLDVLGAQLEVQGCDMPQRVCMLPGSNVAYDADQLTINLVAIGPGQPGEAATRAFHPGQLIQTVEWEVNLLRKVRVQTDGAPGHPQPPSPSVLTKDFVKTATDAQYLWAALATIHAQGLINPVNIPFFYGPLRPVGPEAGLAGSRVNIVHQFGTASQNPNYYTGS